MVRVSVEVCVLGLPRPWAGVVRCSCPSPRARRPRWPPCTWRQSWRSARGAHVTSSTWRTTWPRPGRASRTNPWTSTARSVPAAGAVPRPHRHPHTRARTPSRNGQRFDELKNELVVTEKLILKNLGFMVSVQHPHKLVVSVLKVLGALDSPLPQQAWNYMNDRFAAAPPCGPLVWPSSHPRRVPQLSHQRVRALPGQRHCGGGRAAGRAHRRLPAATPPALVDAPRGHPARYGAQ
jgi:hypothetical protein